MTVVYLLLVSILHLAPIPVPVTKDILEMEKLVKVRKQKWKNNFLDLKMFNQTCMYIHTHMWCLPIQKFWTCARS